MNLRPEEAGLQGAIADEFAREDEKAIDWHRILLAMSAWSDLCKEEGDEATGLALDWCVQNGKVPWWRFMGKACWMTDELVLDRSEWAVLPSHLFTFLKTNKRMGTVAKFASMKEAFVSLGESMKLLAALSRTSE